MDLTAKLTEEDVIAMIGRQITLETVRRVVFGDYEDSVKVEVIKALVKEAE